MGIYVKKGEILVSGILELKDDSQEVVKYEAVHADADIYIKRQKAYYHEIPMIYETYEWTGKKKKGIYLKAGRFYLEIADRTKNWLVSDSRRTENVSDQKFSAAVLNRVYYPKPVQKDKKTSIQGKK